MDCPPEKDATEADGVAHVVEAMLFASDCPLTAAKIAKIGDVGTKRAVKKAVEKLNSRYEKMGCAFCIEEIAGGYQMMTRSEYNDVLSRLLQSRRDTHLTKAAMETLAVVAYRQPVMRADIEAIRGVACGEVLRGLMEKQLVKIVGRAPVLGRPILYGTTRRFLETFGLADLEDLPKVEQLRGGDKQPAKADHPPGQAASRQGQAEQQDRNGEQADKDE
ncbi:MAG: SMC-Scp complex subunit ScpB [Phycisphaerae bacterium]|nr:SMC-Scp complex subunit ScpB [Phycisphaerae bacterium]